MSTGRRLPVGAIDVVGADGATRIALHVFCPREVHAVSLDACSTCPACRCFDAGELTGSRPAVLCGTVS
jgi:hypothetical protein